MAISNKFEVIFGILCLVSSLVGVLPVACLFFAFDFDFHMFSINNLFSSDVDLSINYIACVVVWLISLNIKIAPSKVGSAVNRITHLNILIFKIIDK